MYQRLYMNKDDVYINNNHRSSRINFSIYRSITSLKEQFERV
jgi:hypothetical protein